MEIMGTEFNLSITWGWVVNATHICFKPRKPPVPIGVEEEHSGQVHKISLPTGFDDRTVVSCYIVCYPGPHVAVSLMQIILKRISKNVM